LFDERGFDAVTIADVARAADVAVQTVFNHFATKEELFFDGRVSWVDGPAASVTSRRPAEPPLSALRGYLVTLTGSLVSSLGTEERRRYLATIEASPTLLAHEREHVFEAERRLAAALLEAWTDPATPRPVPANATSAAELTAAIWLSAMRALVVGQRPHVAAGACPRELGAGVERLAAALLGRLEAMGDLSEGSASGQPTTEADGSSDTGWPQAGQRAG
jgi:AcrR family transcriptional regulator